MHTYYISGFSYSDGLYHDGIKGMKHGVRRFQNLDRTWTEAGKIRYSKAKKRMAEGVQQVGAAGKKALVGAAKVTGKAAVATGKTIGKAAKAVGTHELNRFKTRHPWMMSDQELNDQTQRLNRERTLLQTKADIRKLNEGRRILGTILERGAGTIGDAIFRKIATNITTSELEKENKQLDLLTKNKELREKLNPKEKHTITDIKDIMDHPERYSRSEIKDASETLGKLVAGRKLVENMYGTALTREAQTANRREHISNIGNTSEASSRFTTSKNNPLYWADKLSSNQNSSASETSNNDFDKFMRDLTLRDLKSRNLKFENNKKNSVFTNFKPYH